MRLAKTNASLLALVYFAGCASLRSTSSNRLDQQIAQADMAGQNLDADNRAAYNNAVACIARQIDDETPNELHSQLDSLGVTLDVPAVKLPLVRFPVTFSFYMVELLATGRKTAPPMSRL
jgi:hypothetical protein